MERVSTTLSWTACGLTVCLVFVSHVCALPQNFGNRPRDFYGNLLSDLERTVGHNLKFVPNPRVRSYPPRSDTYSASRAASNHVATGDDCAVPVPSRLDCYPGGGSTKENCEAKGCCWVPVRQGVNDVPWCFYKADNSSGYVVTGQKDTDVGFSVTMSRNDTSRWPDDVMELQMDVEYLTASTLHFKIFDPKNKRFEPPVSTPNATKKASSPRYTVETAKQGDPFSFVVSRESGAGKPLFSTKSTTKLTFADQYIQISTVLPTKYIYGLGEHRGSLLHDASQSHVFGFWARDQPPAERINLYGSYPFYIGMEDSGEAFGVFLLNSNAMDVSIQPNGDKPILTFTVIGGLLDFYVFTGPSPNHVVQQYTAVIGRSFMPPYWALGFHLCRWGFGGTDGMKKVIQRMRDAKMPYDTQWNDIDYMSDHKDWTYDKDKFKDLPAVVQDLHQNGQHYIMIIDPGIPNVKGYQPYDDGMTEGIFIKNADGSEVVIGKVWPGTTAFPDFTNPKSLPYWENQAKSFYDQVPFDGIWIDMNEPSNFVYGSTNGCPKNNKWDNPPYVPQIGGGHLPDKTLCTSSQQFLGKHYDLHNLYGHTELIASAKAANNIRGKRSLVISRSTFPSSGIHGGHWLGDNNAQEQDMKYSIAGILNFNFFGIPLVGADICGFMGDTTEELCTRWMQVGAFYPFMRNHNQIDKKDQDPAAFSKDAQDAMRKALNLRYSLLPYLYTLMYESHVNGSAVARPLFFQYPTDADTYAIDTQFMWGESLLISPVLEMGKTSVDAYLPKDAWYDFFTGEPVPLHSTGKKITFDAPLDSINVHVRGQNIIPMQEPAVTTTLSRKNNFKLLVTLQDNGVSLGQLYWDDGETLESTSPNFNLIRFMATPGGTLESFIESSGYTTDMTLDEITVYGVTSAPKSVQINGKDSSNFSYDLKTKKLVMSKLSLSLLTKLQIRWG